MTLTATAKARAAEVFAEALRASGLVEQEPGPALILGIDPGLKGGIAVLPGPVAVPMPTTKTKAGRETYDVPGVVMAIRRAGASSLLRGRVLAFLEKGQPLPPMLRGRGAGGGGSIANYHRGLGRGLFEGILTALGIEYRLLAPREWQDEMLPIRGGDTGERSIIAAEKLFPGVSLYATPRSRKKSDGLSDALLIAEHGRRKLEKDSKNYSGKLFQEAR